MSTIFAGIPGVVVFLDDIVVHWATLATHNERLARVSDVLARHTLTLNEEKCTFAASVIEFVGFCLSAEGLSPLHSNVEAVLSQLQGGTERPVAFASRSLNAAEQKYSVGEQEALACPTRPARVWVRPG